MTPVTEALAEQFSSVSWEISHDQDVASVPVSDWRAFAEAAKNAGFELCSDITAVDWMRSRSERFQVVATLTSLSLRARLRMTTSVGRDDPTLDSITPVWPGAGFAEREVFDMFGIEFAGHPDLTRILMPDDWDGHPLRKDFGVGSVPVQFKASHQAS